MRSLANGICEGIWLKRSLEDLKVNTGRTVRLLCDNQSSLSISKDPIQHDRTTHIEIDPHFIKEEDKRISMEYVPSKLQVADILTKPLNSFHDMCSKLDLLNIYHQA